jgi:hypothetical protein
VQGVLNLAPHLVKHPILHETWHKGVVPAELDRSLQILQLLLIHGQGSWARDSISLYNNWSFFLLICDSKTCAVEKFTAALQFWFPYVSHEFASGLQDFESFIEDESNEVPDFTLWSGWEWNIGEIAKDKVKLCAVTDVLIKPFDAISNNYLKHRTHSSCNALPSKLRVPRITIISNFIKNWALWEASVML